MNTLCTFGGLNTNNWIGINMLVILLFFTIAALIYALSNILPGRTGEKLRGVAKFEVVQSMLSLFIIAIIMLTASVACNVSQQITGTDPFSFAKLYVGTLVFVQGVNLVTRIYTVTIQYFIIATIVQNLGFPGLTGVYDAYSTALTVFPVSIVIGTFGMLLIQYLTLPIIEAIALTIMVPLALVLRSFSFFGPKYREAADSFLALAIALYFIFPLTFMLDSVIINWTYGTCPTCNPYPQFIAPYTLNTIPSSSLFASQNVSGELLGFPISFATSLYSTAFSNGISLANIVDVPLSVITISSEVSEYAFQGVVLIAINLALTIAFAIGLTKGLTHGLDFIRGGGFW